MRLGKEICNLQGRMNKRQSNGAMLEMMTSKMTIDLNVLSSLIKTELWAIWIELWLSQFIGVGWEKKTLISASNQRNQTISLVVNAMTEAEGKSKYQILQKQKTKYHSNFIFFCRHLVPQQWVSKHSSPSKNTLRFCFVSTPFHISILSALCCFWDLVCLFWLENEIDFFLHAIRWTWSCWWFYRTTWLMWFS